MDAFVRWPAAMAVPMLLLLD